MRRAVGLARNLQDPLTFHAALFEADAVLSLPLHPLQVRVWTPPLQPPALPRLAEQPLLRLLGQRREQQLHHRLLQRQLAPARESQWWQRVGSSEGEDPVDTR